MANKTASKSKTNRGKKSNNSKKIVAIVVAIVAILAVIGTTYAIFTVTVKGTKTNVIEVGTLTLTLDESASEGITIQNAVPVSEEYALQNYTAYTFKVKNTGTIDAKYNLTLVDDQITGTRINDEYVRYSLETVKVDKSGNKGTATTKKNLLSTLTSRTLDSEVTVAAGESYEYKLYLWIDHDATNEIAGQKFSAKVNIDAVQNLE